MRYPLAIEPRTDEAAYRVVVPDLPGCFSAGDTLEEAIAGTEEVGRGSRLRSTMAIRSRRPGRWKRSAVTLIMPAGFFRSLPSTR